MGSYLSEPIEDKHTSDGANQSLMFAASAMQGWRTSKKLNYF